MLDFSDVKLIVKNTTELEDGKLLSEFEIYPLPRGYGHTVGNMLRRTLLSSIPGYAITQVRINDKSHEFSTIPGVLENVLDIVLRLKRVRFRVKGDAPMYTVKLDVNGGKVQEVKAKDLDMPGEVEVVNKDFLLATLTDKSAKLQIEAVLEKGVGYAERDESVRDEIGAIPVDAVFSPVKVVDYKVLPVSKQGEVKFEKIELKVETDGGVTPEEAVKEAVRVLRDLVDHMAELLGIDRQGDKKQVETQDIMDLADSITTGGKPNDTSGSAIGEKTPIEEVGLSANIVKALKAEGITTLGDLALIDKEDLLKIKGIGKSAIKKIEEVLKDIK